MIEKSYEEECSCCGTVLTHTEQIDNTITLEVLKELVRFSRCDTDNDYMYLEYCELEISDDIPADVLCAFRNYFDSDDPTMTPIHYKEIADRLGIVTDHSNPSDRR